MNINIKAESVNADWSANALDVSVDFRNEYIYDVLSQFPEETLINALCDLGYSVIGKQNKKS